MAAEWSTAGRVLPCCFFRRRPILLKNSMSALGRGQNPNFCARALCEFEFCEESQSESNCIEHKLRILKVTARLAHCLGYLFDRHYVTQVTNPA